MPPETPLMPKVNEDVLETTWKKDLNAWPHIIAEGSFLASGGCHDLDGAGHAGVRRSNVDCHGFEPKAFEWISESYKQASSVLELKR